MSSRSQRARADAVLKDLLERPADEREDELVRQCGDDAELTALVRRVLALAEDAADRSLDPDGLLAGTVRDDLLGRLDDPVRGTGRRLGPFRLLRELGRGGMGVVYLAERADGRFEQQVAIKVASGPASAAELSLLERERRILATLAHPNIARLLDGGEIDGRPYLVMEHVEGEPIDDHCDRRRLSLDARLEMMLSVCRAVQHAHRHLVIHRDIKPSNILVAHDGTPKLLDFGIAKLLDPEAVATRTTSRLLTPEYASPEQLLGEPVSLASDVYQLGLLFYRLLTGGRAQEVDESSPRALERSICETEPQAPSTAVARRPADDAWFGRIATSPARLGRALRGGLDAVVLKAIRKEPSRRYATVEQLADDLERFRDGRPVRARPDSTAYRLRRFVGRHTFGVAAAIGFVLLLVGWGATATLQTHRVREQRDRAVVKGREATEMRDFLVGLFTEAHPYLAAGETFTVVDLVDVGVDRLRDDLGDQPKVRAEMLSTLGEVLMELGSGDRAREALHEALALQRRHEVPPGEATAFTLERLGRTYFARNDVREAERLQRESLAIRRRVLGEPHDHVAISLKHVGNALYDQARYAEAEALWRESLEMQIGLHGRRHAHVAATMNNLAIVHEKMGLYAEAERLQRESLEIRRSLFPDDHAAVLESLNNLGVLVGNLGRDAEAEALYRQTLAGRRRVFGSHHSRVANTLYNLGNAVRRQGRWGEAEALHREALEIRRASDPEHPAAAMSLGALGVLYLDSGRTDEALEHLRCAYVIAQDRLAPGHFRRLLASVHYGRGLVDAAEPERAEPLLREVLASAGTTLGDEHWMLGYARLELGRARAALGDPIGARALVGEAHARLRGTRGEHHELTRRAAVALESLSATRSRMGAPAESVSGR